MQPEQPQPPGQDPYGPPAGPQPQPNPGPFAQDIIPPQPVSAPPPPHQSVPPAFHSPVPAPAPNPAFHQDEHFLAPDAASKPKSGKKWLVWLVIILVIAAVAAGAYLFMKSNNKKAAAPTTPTTQQNEGPQPAEAADVDATSTSITQDIAGVHDDTDLPATTLDDKTLGL